jgi:adenosylhomocysteine nucleosidase
MDPTPLLPKYQIPLTDLTFMMADSNMCEAALNSAQHLRDNLSIEINEEHLQEFNITQIKVGKGTIASGDSFIASAEEANKVKQDIAETTAVEMEGAAVAQVCQDYQLPFVIVRTISDNANNDSHVDFPSFIKEIASAYTKAIITNFIPTLCSTESKTEATAES